MSPLLFDENLSPRLPHRLTLAFPASQHVRDLELRGCSDLDLLLEHRKPLIEAFEHDPEEALLVLRLPRART